MSDSEQDAEFLKEYNTSFLQDMDLTAEVKMKKPKRGMREDSDSDWEQKYEKKVKLESTKLPIKMNGQVIFEKEIVVKESAEIFEQEKEPKPTVQQPKSKEKVKSKLVVPVKSSSISQVKNMLAEYASSIIEDPEANVKNLKFLQCKDKRPNIISLHILTQLAVYRDIIPGYRIRSWTEKEQAGLISNQVKKMRNYEETLLSSYQEYLVYLELLLKKYSNEKELVKVAIMCMCQLLQSCTHFNFRVNIMTMIVNTLASKTHASIGKICADTLSTIFREDESGQVSLECVKLLSDRIYSVKYAILPVALEPFISLRLTHELRPKALERTKEHIDKKDRVYFSKKKKKEYKFMKQVEEEMGEAEATYDKDEREKMHSETLKFVFITYFRILKNAPKSHLVPTVLEGLAKFAHLINIDFFEDLLAVLKKISLEQHQAYISGKDDASTTPISALHCIVAALELMESMGGAIEMDMTDFYTALYTQMNRLAVRPGSFDQFRLSKSTPRNEIELTLQGLKFMLKKHRKMPLDRVGAFMKRLSILALSTPSNCTMANLFTIREAAMRYPQLKAYWEEDGRLGTGIYNPYLDDPNLCNPFATTMWETTLLTQHYHPVVRGIANSILDIRQVSQDQEATVFDLQTLMKGKINTISKYASFQSEGFELVPGIRIPKSVTHKAAKLSKGSLDGPTAFSNSDFLGTLTVKNSESWP